MKKMEFHQEARRECIKTLRLKLPPDDRWNGNWKMKKKDKTELLLDVMVPWEEYFEQMKRRKSEKI